MRIEKLSHIHSTNELTLTTSPVDYSSNLPATLDKRLGLNVIFEGDNLSGAVYFGASTSKRIKIPVEQYYVIDALDLQRFTDEGQLNVWAEVGGETVTMTVSVVGA